MSFILHSTIHILQNVGQWFCIRIALRCYDIVFSRLRLILFVGVSAGLAGFSFLWHVFIHFYYLIKRYTANDEFERFPAALVSSRIIDNLSTSFIENHRNCGSGPSSIISNNLSQASVSLTDSLRNFEKPMYKTDDKNFMSKKQSGSKNVEKNKIFGFNKRKPIYEREDFDLYESNNVSTVFFEIDDSGSSNQAAMRNKVDLGNASTSSNKELDNFINENSSNMHLSKNINDFKYKFHCESHASGCDDELMYKKGSDSAIPTALVIADNRNSLLKRKGICSSQEMIHLVDIMNDHISPEQVDVLAKSLVELGGDVSLQTESEQDDPNNSRLLDQFPDMIADHRLLENIDAAIYENQIIFQERIRKNQLTIQNLKLQDQMLSKCIEDMKSPNGTELLSIRDYENMCFTNISRQNRGMKHWRNYLQDIDTSNHDSSTVQHSSYYVNTNTMSNSLTDLYINEGDENTSTVIIDDDEEEKMSSDVGKKTVRWRSKLSTDADAERMRFCSDDDNTVVSDDLYINMDEGGTIVSSLDNHSVNGARALPEKNILVETINKINVDSPIKSLSNMHKPSQSLNKM